MNVPKDYKEFFELLHEEKVKYLIVGAYAVSFHSDPRYTGDIDILIEKSPTNAKKVFNVVCKFGFANVGIEEEDFLKDDMIIQLGFAPLRIDIITGVDNVVFQDAWKRRVSASYGNLSVWYISKNDLLLSKKSSTRKRDILDVEMLTKKNRTKTKLIKENINKTKNKEPRVKNKK